jgi:hypothetical protein
MEDGLKVKRKLTALVNPMDMLGLNAKEISSKELTVAFITDMVAWATSFA